MNEILNSTYFSNTIQAWLIAAAIIVVSFIMLSIFKSLIITRFKKWSAKTNSTLDDFLVGLIEKSAIPLLYVFCAFFAVNSLTQSPQAAKIIHVAFLFIVTYYVLGVITTIIRQFIFSFIKSDDENTAKEKQAKGLLIIINIIIWIVGIVFVIDNLGYNVSTLVAGMGIGGIAIALAAQTILGDLFSYFVIFFDRPFEIGDFIIVEDKMGTIEYVGIKTTRIKTLNGEQLICSNTYLTNARVHNYKRMQERRIVFKLGVVYDTAKEKIQMIPGAVRKVIDDCSDVRFDRGHFSGFGNFSLDFEFVYYVESADYNIYMDKQQEIYLAIFDIFEKEQIDFAYPTQTVLINPMQNTRLDPSTV